jgi:hypothetical protein
MNEKLSFGLHSFTKVEVCARARSSAGCLHSRGRAGAAAPRGRGLPGALLLWRSLRLRLGPWR